VKHRKLIIVTCIFQSLVTNPDKPGVAIIRCSEY